MTDYNTKCIVLYIIILKAFENMIRVSFFYPNTDGSSFDAEYYRTKHAALFKKRLAPELKSFSIDYGLSGIGLGSKSPFHAVANLFFDSVEAFYHTLMPHAEELEKDGSNYTDVEPVVQISDVRINEVIEAG